MRPENIGIHAIEIYFPKTYVNQEQLEQFDGVAKGKYTIGLGQKNMAFTDYNEDINSISLTVLTNLLEKYNISPHNIGRLEVGTETLLDKSKSVKTVLMQVFKNYGNDNLEGVTNTNACYGATSALFNTIAWVESSAWDGRFGIVIAADIAVYAKGPARPTGGAGAVAMLIGPNAPIVIEIPRSSFFDHAYDFYKPDPKSEYPTVDGQNSIHCYLKAIDKCYKYLQNKLQVLSNEQEFCVQSVDYLCFHTPFKKMVQKSFLKLIYNDIINNKLEQQKYLSQQLAEVIDKPEILEAIQYIQAKQNFLANETQKKLINLSKDIWNKKVEPTLTLSTELGNIYTGALYGSLISLISNQSELLNKRILMFSYGSGLASSMFLLRVTKPIQFMRETLKIPQRLSQRMCIAPSEYDQIMQFREDNYGTKPPYKINNSNVNLERLFDKTYYLVSVDGKWRREYKIKSQNKFADQVLQVNIVKNHTSGQTNNNNSSSNANRLQQLEQNMTKSQIVSENVVKNLSKNQNELLFSGFYKKSLKERVNQIKKLDPEISIDQFESGGLSLSQASLMIENCIGKISLPLGLGLNFLINGKYYQIPMAIEEPSIIAAASNAAKTIANAGGFKTYSTRPIMIGQIQVLDCDPITSQIKIDHHRDKILEEANKCIPNMVKRGGGCIECKTKIVSSQNNQNIKVSQAFNQDSKKPVEMLIVELHLNVCDSMGANIVNTVSEHVAQYIQNITNGRIGIKILSNLCLERRAVSEFIIPFKELGYKTASGELVASRIIETYQFAQLDIRRATTHNKGIMNGIDAVAMAFGQDWRAIEAAAHAFPYHKYGQYQPLTQYEIVEINGQKSLKGILEIPLSVGSQGGVLNSNPIYQNNMRMLGFPNAQVLSEIMTCVGLAQNFAAMRALALEGIQRGHMALHAKNIALSAGVPTYLVEDAVNYMKTQSRVSIDDAKKYLEACDMFSSIRAQSIISDVQTEKQLKPLSTFYVKLKLPKLPEALILHIAFDCLDDNQIHLSFEENNDQKQQNMTQIQKELFGPKQYEWLANIFKILEEIKINFSEYQMGKSFTINNQKNFNMNIYKLKLIVILIDILSFNLLKLNSEKTIFIFQNIQQEIMFNKTIDFKDILSYESQTVKYGLSLFCELMRVFNYTLNIATKNTQLKKNIKKEVYSLIECQLQCIKMWNLAKEEQYNFQDFLYARKKRYCGTIIMLCDLITLPDHILTEKKYTCVKQYGNLFELKSTIFHDLAKYQQFQDYNIYQYWLMMNKKYLRGNEENTMNEFLALSREIINQKQQKIEKKIKDLNLTEYDQKTFQIITNYYKEYLQDSLIIENFINNKNNAVIQSQVLTNNNIKPNL